MPLVIPSGYAQCSIEIQAALDTDPYFVTFGIQSPIVTDVAEDVADSFSTAWAARLDNGFTITGCRVRDSVSVDEFAANTTGTRAGTELPCNCACLIRKRSSLVGRKNRGRMFMPGLLPASDIGETGIIQSTLRTNIQNAANAWFTDMSTRGFDLAILHTSSTSPTLVSSLEVDNVIATQRRRLR